MRVLAITHGPTVRPELLGELVVDQGHELIEWPIAELGRPPEADAVVVLGGQMNVGEEDAHPWLELEYELLREWVAAGQPLLGVCLGAQTLAHALGGQVSKLPERQSGLLDVGLTDAGIDDRVLGVLPPRVDALFANGYRFEVPMEGVELMTGFGRSQAFRVGDSAWGVQFHPEARHTQVMGWWSDGRVLPRPLPDLEQELTAGIATWQAHGARLALAFLATAAAI